MQGHSKLRFKQKNVFFREENRGLTYFFYILDRIEVFKLWKINEKHVESTTVKTLLESSESDVNTGKRS